MNSEREEFLKGLPSIGFNSSPKELLDLYIQISAKRHPSLEERPRSPFEVHFFTLYQTSIGLSLGLMGQSQVDDALESLMREPEPENLMDISRFWLELKKDMPQLDLTDAQTVWENGINRQPNIYRQAYQTSLLLTTLSQQRALHEKELAPLKSMTEKIAGTLPTYDLFNTLTNADVLSMLWFIQNSKKLGIPPTDIEEYFAEALPNIELETLDSYIITSLMKNMFELNLDRETQLTRTNMCIVQAKNMTDTKRRDAILGAAVAGLLKLDRYEQAIQIWRDMTSQSSLTFCVADLAIYAIKTGRIANFEAELPKYLDKMAEAHPDDPDFRELFLEDWGMQWHFAALMLAKQEGLYAFETPVIAKHITSGEADFNIEDLAECVVQFPDKPVLKKMVLDRLSELITKFNLGNLHAAGSKGTLRALMILKSKGIDLE